MLAVAPALPAPSFWTLGDAEAELLRHHDDALQVRLRQTDRELLAAHPGRSIRAPEFFLEETCTCPSRFIAGRAAVSVVDLPEAINIQHEESERVRIAPGAENLGDEAPEEVAPAGQLRRLLRGGPFSTPPLRPSSGALGPRALSLGSSAAGAGPLEFDGQVRQFPLGLWRTSSYDGILLRSQVEEVGEMAHVAGH